MMLRRGIFWAGIACITIAIVMVPYTANRQGSTADTIGLVFWDVGAILLIASFVWWLVVHFEQRAQSKRV